MNQRFTEPEIKMIDNVLFFKRIQIYLCIKILDKLLRAYGGCLGTRSR